MTSSDPLYLGFDLSTQQLKGIAVTSNLRVAYQATFDFDADASGYIVKKGVLTNEAEHEVFAPVAMGPYFLELLPRFTGPQILRFRTRHPKEYAYSYLSGGLAREQIRDALGPSPSGDSVPWTAFNNHALSTAALGASSPGSPLKIALYFPRPEIVPNVRAGKYRYICTPGHPVQSNSSAWDLPSDDCRAIIESQLLSLRLRSRNIVAPPSPNPEQLPAQPRRIYLVGGGSQNPAIAKIAGEVLGGVEGIYRLDVGGNACALGSAYKAVWAVERKKGETFEQLIRGRWNEEDFVIKVAKGYQRDVYAAYEKGVEALEAVEKETIGRQGLDVRKLGTTGAGQL
ncbi:hypothetical protein P7C71_g1265, partial [Lecanoromycetidae sp. Uapishka_2]